MSSAGAVRAVHATGLGISRVSAFDAFWETLTPELRAANASSTFGRAATQAVPSSPLPLEALPLVDVTSSGDIALGELLGEGGMGVVHVGWQRALSREVAVKVARRELAADERARSILLMEAALAGALEHPNIIPVHLLGRDSTGSPVMVMKRVVGEPWSALIRDDDHPAWTTFTSLSSDRLRSHLEILMQVSNAVSFAHARGVIHRDIKPDNVLVGAFGEVQLADWGISARVAELRFEGALGTPELMAPELVDGAIPQGPWTDVYLLGASLHTVLARAPRHRGATLREVLAAAWASEAVDYPPSVPVELAQLANRATARDPAARLSSAVEFRRALSDFLQHRASASLAESARQRLDDRPRDLATAEQIDQACRIARESRFGFMTALRDWPENAAAQDGLRAAVSVLIDVDIARGNPQGARALLSELTPPSPSIEARVADLERAAERRAREEAGLRELARDLDPSVTSRARMVFVLLVVVMGVGLLVLSWRDGAAATGERAQAQRLVLIAAGLVAAEGALVVLVRRRLLKNAFGRRASVALLSTMVGIFANRCLGLLDGRPVAATLRSDMLLCALGFCLLGVFSARVWLLGATLLLLGAVATLGWPERAGDLFGVVAILALALVAVLERRRQSALR
ncbi:MAG: serine/threonine protein kinase [Polyangiaceae bacterium]|jgi:hypothetical protein|nr:serine/threonine protein kinase [Polyangiaceae bacterium]